MRSVSSQNLFPLSNNDFLGPHIEWNKRKYSWSCGITNEIPRDERPIPVGIGYSTKHRRYSSLDRISKYFNSTCRRFPGEFLLYRFTPDLLWPQLLKFDESYRPCKLERIVVPVNHPPNQNDYAFMNTLDSKLYEVLNKHSSQKPILIFVSTRKGIVLLPIGPFTCINLEGSAGVFSTAEQLHKEYQDAQSKRRSLPWASPRMYLYLFLLFWANHLMFFATGLTTYSRTNVLQVCIHLANSDDTIWYIFHVALASAGIGVHNAGMALDDRRAVEDLYLKGTLRVIVSTSVRPFVGFQVGFR